MKLYPLRNTLWYQHYRLLTFNSGFKDKIYETDHSRVEQALSKKKSQNLSLRLMLMNAHKDSDPELTQTIQEVYRDAPLLF